MASLGFGNTKEGVKEDFRGFKNDARELKDDVKQGARNAEQRASEYASDAKHRASEYASDAKHRASEFKEEFKEKDRLALPIPAFSDMGKAANDMINKDFYHTAQATLDVKLKAPNGANVNIKGKQGFDGVTTGSAEGKYALKPHGVTITEAWSTASLLDSKVELADVIAPGVKVDLQNLWNPSKGNSIVQKLNLAFKNNNIHSRAFVNYAQSNGNIDAVVDAVFGHDGFLVGGEAGYDLQKAAITKYSVGLGYQTAQYTASINGIQNLSVIAASYYQKVSSQVQVGAKAGYDVQASKPSGLELASKYQLDPLSFAKVKINDRGIAALAYSTKMNAATTLGLGLSLDTNKLNEAGHKIGTSLTFEG